MKQQEVFKKIGGIVAEINDQYQYLQTAGEIYNDLELELLLANANFLADHIEILRKANAAAAKDVPPVQAVITSPPPPPAPAPIREEKPVAEPHFFAPVPAEEPEEEPTDAPVFEFEVDNHIEIPEEPEPTPEPEPIRHELTLEDIGEDWDEEDDETEAEPTPVAKAAEPKAVAPEPVIAEEVKATPIPEIKKPEPVTPPTPVKQETKVEPPHTQILVPEDHVLTLNERMSAQAATPRMSDSFSGQAISDLKTAISLNDKLLYIKDLFNGYSLAYSEAIDILNRYKTFEEAENFLKGSYAVKNNWADKQATADRFYALLQRRYAV